jgi:hypothetical protein
VPDNTKQPVFFAMLDVGLLGLVIVAVGISVALILMVERLQKARAKWGRLKGIASGST